MKSPQPSSCFCLIPAKAGSIRLKHKNILPLAGREMMSYAIAAARQSQLFGEEVIVSTESARIREVALRYGAQVPDLRDEKLARDPYEVYHVALDFLERHPAYQLYEHFCIVMPTAPLVQASDISAAYQVVQDKGYDSLMSVNETEHNSLRSVRIQDHTLQPLFPEHLHKGSRQLEKTYQINGAVVWLKTAAFLAKGTYFIDPIGTYIMPRERSIDIDTEMDYLFAKFLLEQHRPS